MKRLAGNFRSLYVVSVPPPPPSACYEAPAACTLGMSHTGALSLLLAAECESGFTPSLTHLPETFNLWVLTPLHGKCTKDLISHNFKEMSDYRLEKKKKNGRALPLTSRSPPSEGVCFLPFVPTYAKERFEI